MKPYLFLASLILISLIVNAEVDVTTRFKNFNPFLLRNTSELICGDPINAPCPKSAKFHYFECCVKKTNETNKNEETEECCLRPQDWIITLFGFAAIVLFIALLTSCVRCACK